MKRQWRKLLAGASVFALTASLLPTGLTVSAAGSEAGTPYTAEGTYDVTVPHVIVNQVYGGFGTTALQATALLSYITRQPKMWI